ncbi:gluconate 2-dehydrogenase subunit 3 family protein [Heyndrickxia acidicola]|uniref:Gluconate 2-dehydrogenase subunit 3 family protein n=1 Tax=Heyndrickxia acidicola TaxID=209389 RepID=A0ABU6MLJ6_9BACI|nr:gluconate 2-dehydrogenase subunit 3 family protein [Heyndrickxia acidicola]MED1205556.1 gluconate 2-dehydrogenase subunit 3 family protein [Heyndrickxia acidicola]
MNNIEKLPVLMFLNQEEARTIEAMASRIIPSDEHGAGAKEAGALIYIDQSLAGYFRHLQTFYRQGLIEFEGFCRETFGASFIELTEEQQDQILLTIEQFQLADPLDSSDDIVKKENLIAQFFAVVHEHTLQGTFGDPLYGGNRDALGWKLIGFPGAQWGYTPEQMHLGFDVNKIEVKTLSDIQREYKPVVTEVKL